VPAHHEATVVRIDKGGLVLETHDGGTLEATARGALRGRRKALGNTVVVGDRVRYELDHERVLVAETLPRRNAFSRRAAGDRPEEQVVASNLDQVVVVASVADPEFKPGFVDRVLAQAEHAGIPARLVVNKSDLASPGVVRGIVDDYARAGYAVIAVSAKRGDEVEHVHQVCRGRRSLFVGHSGVGKSTLLMALAPDLALASGEVNPVTGKGRHTTTAAWLLRADPDLELIDTPGMRSFGLWGIGARDLDQSYPEFRRWLGECRFADCRHAREPGCALRAAAASGEIAERRLASYVKLRDELEEETGDRRWSRGAGAR